MFLCRMIAERAQGIKRKLSDVDDDVQTRCYQRQTVFNISLCKLRKNYCNGEPMLSKTVLIANTIRLIELEMAEENGNTSYYTTTSSSSPSQEIGARIENNENIVAHKTRETFSKPLDLVNFEEELDLLGDKIVRELGLDLSKNYERKTTISCEELTDTNNNPSSERTVDSDLRDSSPTVSCSSLLGLELADELEFGDVDLSLYDFDSCGSTVLPFEVEELCAAWTGLTNALRCSNSVKKERAVNENFDELDQVMQILVGS